MPDGIMVDFSRPPNAKERDLLAKRLHRLEAMRESISKATGCLAELATRPSFTDVRIRRSFVRLNDPAPGDASDRNLPPPEHRPPATRLLSPRGAALRLYMTALFEAQAVAHGRPGTHPKNPRPLVAADATIAWVDVIASPSQRSKPDARVYMSVHAKKLRQLKYALGTLANQELVFLPREEAAGNKFEGFELLHEGGRRHQGDNIPYTLPKATDLDLFAVPVTLFTHGWIHVLEDTELVFLLLLASRGADSAEIAINSEERLLHYGIGRDAYEAHRLLDRLGVIDVQFDPNRLSNGKIEGFTTDGNPAQPHRFRLLPDNMATNAYDALHAQLSYQLNR